MSSRKTIKYDLTSLTALNEATPMILSGDFRNAVFTIHATDTAAYTLKFYISNQEERPDLTSAVSATNLYSETKVINLNDGASITGTTWLAVSANGVIMVELNQNLNRWIWVKVSAYTSGTANLSVTLSDNQ